MFYLEQLDLKFKKNGMLIQPQKKFDPNRAK